MDTYRKAKKLRGTRSKSNSELLDLAKELGLKVNQNDTRLLGLAAKSQEESEACEDARERLLLRLDGYQSSIRSKLSQGLSFISVLLSIVAALLSIYASIIKK